VFLTLAAPRLSTLTTRTTNSSYFISRLRPLRANVRINTTHTECDKNARLSLQKIKLHHSTKQKYLVGAWPPSYGRVTTQTLQEIDFWDPLVFHHVWLGLLTAIFYATPFQSCCKLRICRLEVSYGSCWWSSKTFSSCISRILEQLVSETVDGTRWTNSMACSLPWNKSLRLSSLVTSKLYSLCTAVGDVQHLQQRTECVWGEP